MSSRDAESQEPQVTQPTRFLRMTAVVERTGLNKRTIQRRIAANNFPKPVSLGDRAIGFVEAEIEKWMEDRMEARE